MNKNEIISKFADRAKFTKAEASRALDAFLEVVSESLKEGKDIRLVGFGTFFVAHRKEGTGRNIRTGEPIVIPAARIPKFKAGKGLREAVGA